MLRIAVATYLMLVTTAGPLFCCCMPTRLAAMVSPPMTGAPVSVGCHDCCGRPAKSPDRQTPVDDSEAPQPAQPGCPCQGPACSVALLFTSESNKLSALPLDSLACLPPVPSLDLVFPSCSGPSVGTRRAHPFLTADDILHVLHMLRC